MAESFEANARDISIRNAEDSQTTWSRHTEISIGFDDLAENFTDLDDLIEEEDGKLSLRIAEASYEHAESVESATQVVESTITVANLLSAGEADAARAGTIAGDILIQGSELIVADQIEIEAIGNVALADAHGTHKPAET